MTRVTPLPSDLAKLTRSVGRTVAAPKSGQLLNSASRSAVIRARKELENGRASERAMTTTHRPTAQPTPNPARTIPLMSSFHTTPASNTPADTSTIDFAFLPSFESLNPPSARDHFANVRVPLLPDNSVANHRPLHPPEAQDAPLAQPQIIIMAADPTRVSAVSMLSEVEGMSPDGVELSFAHDNWSRRSAEDEGQQYAGGMLRTLWDGLVDDVFGGQQQQKMKPAM